MIDYSEPPLAVDHKIRGMKIAVAEDRGFRFKLVAEFGKFNLQRRVGLCRERLLFEGREVFGNGEENPLIDLEAFRTVL